MTESFFINQHLTWSIREKDIVFQFAGGAPPRLPFSESDLTFLDRGSEACWSTLQELWAREIVEERSPGRWSLPLQRIYDLEEEDYSALVIPAPSRLVSKVQLKGTPGSSRLQAAVIIEHSKLGRLGVDIPRHGPFYLPPSGPPILIPNDLLQLIEVCERGPGRSQLEDHFAFLSEVKRLGQAGGVNLAPFFETEHYHFPSEFQVDINEKSADQIELKPTIRQEGTPRVESEILLQAQPPRIRSFPTPRLHRDRVVFSELLRRQLRDFQKKRHFKGSEIPKLLENPEAFLPEGVDLSDFSKRVKGLRTVVYNSRPYLHVKRSEQGWFKGVPGIQLEPTLEEADPDGESPGSVSAVGKPSGLSPETYRKLAEEARRTGEEYVRHGDGWVRIDPHQAEQFLGTVDGLGEIEQGQLRIPERAVLDIYENIDALEFELPPVEKLGLHRKMADFPDPRIPPNFSGQLKPHQRVGYRWLAYLDAKGTGGLLADDMGLGKTVQVIAHLARLAEEDRLRPALIVCPKTLIDNWCQELNRFFPGHPQVLRYEGGRFLAEQLAQFQIVITTYDKLRREQLELAKIDWKIVACDEAQYAKNPTAQRTTALKALKSAHRVALTGTPVENGLIEFWCIMDFVRPGLLSSWQDFRKEHESPLIEADSEKEREPLVEDLLRQMGAHYIRRMKEDILDDLPPKKEKVLEVQLSEKQFIRYRQIAERAVRGGRGKALAAITDLLVLCGHPAVFSGGSFRYERGDCHKLDKTLDVLEKVRDKGEKAVIFTRFKHLQVILQTSIRDRHGLWPDIINGDVTANRQRIIDIFSAQSGFNVLILSHDVGGVGLNITAANHVIHYTRPWNPAKENQATDRLHRIGQSREVVVYLPVVRDDRFDTVEQRLDELLQSKRFLARDVLRPTKDLGVRPEDLLDCVEEVAKGASKEH